MTEFSAAASLATMILSTPVCLDHLIAIWPWISLSSNLINFNIFFFLSF
jgi:hypothetical protein